MQEKEREAIGKDPINEIGRRDLLGFVGEIFCPINNPFPDDLLPL